MTCKFMKRACVDRGVVVPYPGYDERDYSDLQSRLFYDYEGRPAYDEWRAGLPGELLADVRDRLRCGGDDGSTGLGTLLEELA